jgi:hypothetical protein
VEGKENVLLSDERLGSPPPARRRGWDGAEAGGKDGPPWLVLFGGVNIETMAGRQCKAVDNERRVTNRGWID